VVPTLIKKFGYTSIMQCPKLEKIVINIGVGDATQNAKALEDSVAELATITGQHPVTTKAKKSIANLQGAPRTGDWLQGHAPWTPDVRVLR
jgi:large subunit ribosomal protein L5